MKQQAWVRKMSHFEGQSTLPQRQVKGVVCCWVPCQILHSHKRSFGHAVKASRIFDLQLT
jgi:hypothetical protein